jgi:hypothetical protein
LVAYCFEHVRLDTATLEVSVWKGENPDPKHYDELWDGEIGSIYGFKIVMSNRVPTVVEK